MNEGRGFGRREMLKASGGNVKSLVYDEKSLEKIGWNEKYFVPLHCKK